VVVSHDAANAERPQKIEVIQRARMKRINNFFIYLIMKII
jgi:hypothetical protein